MASRARYVVDNNILIDYLCKREPYDKPANLLMALGAINEFELWMGTSQITDLLYVITEGDAKSKVKYGQGVMRFLKKMLHVFATDEEDWDRVAQSTFGDLEDAFVFQTANRVKADAIISRDKKGFDKSPIKVLDCDELFWELLEQGFGYAEVISDFASARDHSETDDDAEAEV